MKSPEETKKVLNDPIPVHFHIGDPEPRLTPLTLRDLEVLHTNALALIQQLQDDNAQLNRCIENMTDKLNAMNDEVAKLQAERDAAVESMRKDPHCCFHCKHKGEWPSCNSDPRPNGICFEWRGVQKEE